MEEAEFMQRIMPHSQELEEAVLSACLQDPEAAMPIALDNILGRDCFYYEPHAVIFEACATLHRKGKPPDPLAVIAELRNRERLDLAGGESFIYQLLAAVPNASAIETHSRLIAEKAMRRMLIARCNHIISEAYGHAEETDELLDNAERLILGVSECVSDGDVSDLDTAIRYYFDSYEELKVTDEDGTERTTLKRPPGIPTGLTDIDRVLGGFRPQEFVIIGARPSMGKTALVTNFARHAAEKGYPVGIFSLEMSKEQLAMRLLAGWSNVNAERLKIGNFSESELTALSDAYVGHANLPIYFDDSAALTVRSLRNRARRMVHKYGIKMLVVDYLQLMSAAKGQDSREGNRNIEITYISQGLKGLARELKVPVLVCSQLSRASEHRSDQRPRMADLRDSGSIEQDADVILLMYAEDYKAEVKPKDMVVEINIAKNRTGDTRTVNVLFQRDYLRFAGYTKEVDVQYGTND